LTGAGALVFALALNSGKAGRRAVNGELCDVKAQYS